MRVDRGSTTVAMAAVVALLSAVVIMPTAVGVVLGARAQATLAADAAALAAAPATYPGASLVAPVVAARVMAKANGADLVSCRCRIDSSLRTRTVQVATRVTVEVPILGLLPIGATSRAEFDPQRWLGR